MKEMSEMTIAQIEKKAALLKRSADRDQKGFIEILHYLETTKRFRENAAFKDASFADYIGSVYNVTFTWYHGLRVAYNRHAAAAEAFGAGTVAKVARIVPPGKVETVFAAAVTEQAGRRRKLPIQRVYAIAQEFRKPALEKKLAINQGRTERLALLEAENRRLKAENAALHKELIEKNEQIERLKATVSRAGHWRPSEIRHGYAHPV